MKKIICLLAVLLLTTFSVHADDVLPFGLEGELALTTLNFSKHFKNRDSGAGLAYNEEHHGVGLEYKFNDTEHTAGYMEYVNSYGENSRALYGTYNNWMYGVADGYADYDNIGEYRPLVGYVLDYGQVRGLVTPAFVAIGLRVPFS